MTMPFGKFLGVDVEDLPDDYLDWLQSIDLHGRLKGAVYREVECRARQQRYSAAPSVPSVVAIQIRPDELPLVGRVFHEGYRAIARRLHPDAGGDVRQMQALNALADSVRGQLAGLGVSQ